MYSSHDLNEIIKEYVSKLDLQWFEKKEKEFKRNKEYAEEKEAIYILDTKGYPNYGENEEILGYEEVEEIHQINFREYCSCYLPICDATGWGCYAADFYVSKGWHLEISDNIDELAYDLVKEIADYLNDEADVTVVHKFISKQLDSIERELNLRKEALHGEMYAGIMDDFLKLCTYKLYKKFEKQLTRFNETSDYVNRLEFDLNQSEVLSLLFLIQRAGFLRSTDNTTFLRFASDHFKYKAENGEYVKPASLMALQKQYSKIATSQVSTSKQALVIKGLTSISQKLIAIAKNIE